MEVISGWINRHFSNEEAIYLVVFLVVGFALLFVFGGVLAPVLTGLVLAFLLQGLVKRLVGWGVPEKPSVYLTFVFFLGVLITILLFVVPLIWQQLAALRAALPNIITRLQEMLRDLPEVAPGFVTAEQVDQWLNLAAGEVGSASGSLLNAVLTQVPSVVGVLIFLILVPSSVFFFLKDKQSLMSWFQSLLPRERPLLDRVGNEMNLQLANYVRGKAIEILIVGSVTFVVFQFLGVNYAALLGLIVGLSVLVPFVGAAVVTIPVALVAIFQFGWSWEMAWVMIAYGIIQALDGNVLVPLLFSEAVDLHPITIICAVLAFGGLWGVWGVFFAIPLATLVKAIYNAWPTQELERAPPETDGGADMGSEATTGAVGPSLESP
ncbi:MAG: AI-2E family transporter [Gammaproteobacteria bacterium]|nr:MAG: AI-2E family transporter [Gammaproteobacteria bacterium]